MEHSLATDDYVVVNTGAESWERQELLMKNSSVTLPTDVPVGSVAYTPDGSYFAVFDGTDWNQFGGGE